MPIIKEKPQRLTILLHHLLKKISPSSLSRNLSSIHRNLVRLSTSPKFKIRSHFWKIGFKSSKKLLNSKNSQKNLKDNHRNHRSLFMSKKLRSIQLCPAKNQSWFPWPKNFSCWRQTWSVNTKRTNKKAATISEYKTKKKGRLILLWRQRYWSRQNLEDTAKNGLRNSLNSVQTIEIVPITLSWFLILNKLPDMIKTDKISSILFYKRI